MHIVVVTDDAAVVPAGAETVPDPGGGLGSAVEPALDVSQRPRAGRQRRRPRGHRRGAAALAEAGLALVEAPDGTTNALSLPDPSSFAPLYGPGSADRFRAHAPFVTVSIPELEADVDSDADLERLGARLGPRTRALLAVPA